MRRLTLATAALRLACLGSLFLVSSLIVHSATWRYGLVPSQDDLTAFYFPLLTATRDALLQGRLPLWTPDIFSGYPLFADGEAGALYPIHLALLPRLTVEQSLVALRLVHSFLACTFMYWLARTLGLGAIGSAVGAFSYAYSGFAAGQVVHPNVYHALTWLPLQLAFVERAFQAAGATRYRYAMLAGAAFGIQALAVHIHITLMSAAAIGAFAAYRAARWLVTGPELREGDRHGENGLAAALMLRIRAAVTAVLVLCVVGGFGLGIGAVQLLPLHELGQQTYRGQGLDPSFAAMNSIWAGDLLTFALPRLYDTTAAGYWGTWVKWETSLYVGILPLAAALLGVLVGRGRHRLFFGAAAILSILLVMGPHSPVRLWGMLHELPGFEVLRSPGRFSLTFALAVAVLAANGVDRLASRRRASWLGVIATLALGTAAVAAGKHGLEILSQQARIWAGQQTSPLQDYLRLPGAPSTVDGAPLDAPRLGQLLAHAVEPANPWTTWQLLVAVATIAALACFFLGPRLRVLAGGLAAAVVLADLSMVSFTFHPHIEVSKLRPVIPPVLASMEGLYRVLTPPYPGEKFAQVEPNRLLVPGIQEAGGYSSLEPDRHLAYVSAVQYADNDLLDLWNVRYLIRRDLPRLLPSIGLTSFHPDQPIFSGRRGSPGSGGALLPDGGPAHTDELRIVAGLWDAKDIPQGTAVARVTLRSTEGTTRDLDLRAGADVSDMSLQIPGSVALTQHNTAEIAFEYQRSDPAGERYGQRIYYAHLPVEPSMTVVEVVIQNLMPEGGLETFGVGLVDGRSDDVAQARAKAKYRVVHSDQQITVYENSQAMPRAFLVDDAVVVPQGANPLVVMVDGPFDPKRTVVVERPLPGNTTVRHRAPDSRAPEVAAGGPAGLAEVVSYQDDEVVVQTASDRDSVLVLTDTLLPGWHATIDGIPAPLLRADYLFRGVPVPSGHHTVRFFYAPAPVLVGATLMLLSVALLFAVAGAHGALALRRTAPETSPYSGRQLAAPGALPGAAPGAS